MSTLTLDEFHAQIKAQGVPREHAAFVCPRCGVVQSMALLVQAGAGPDADAVEKYIGFSCVGRFTGAGAPRKAPDGAPCNWTLGGLFSMHELEVETPEGEKLPHFAPATPEQAKELMQQLAGEGAKP